MCLEETERELAVDNKQGSWQSLAFAGRIFTLTTCPYIPHSETYPIVDQIGYLVALSKASDTLYKKPRARAPSSEREKRGLLRGPVLR